MSDETVSPRVAVLGLGYVGLPLAVAFARHYPVVGFDVKRARVEALHEGRDDTREVSPAELA
ncbi:Vi polysaccharide biosynthesis UDP-N-acetylglucosamine C-6 dehydrogenase TviB, partial [Arhodomonas aquaeolei]|nr:Vi polysaccharide biosynthesis UDP-N-acetylglucosamine C-6 dehydrogenase TviB [Arhodomonas aquaeolei]